MQCFLPYSDFDESAKCLDYRRLGKQRVECLQILNVLEKYPHKCKFCGRGLDCDMDTDGTCRDGKHCYPISTPWYNHPAVLMWKNHKEMLIAYGYVICQEWKMRGYKDNLIHKFKDLTRDDNIPGFQYAKYWPDWLGNENFHSSHRAALLAKNYDYYSKFGWKEAPLISYWWPTKHLTNQN